MLDIGNRNALVLWDVYKRPNSTDISAGPSTYSPSVMMSAYAQTFTPMAYTNPYWAAAKWRGPTGIGDIGFGFRSITRGIKKIASPVQRAAGGLANVQRQIFSAPLRAIRAETTFLRRHPGFVQGALSGDPTAILEQGYTDYMGSQGQQSAGYGGGYGGPPAYTQPNDQQQQPAPTSNLLLYGAIGVAAFLLLRH